MNFKFFVGKEHVEPTDGLISIGITVEEIESCTDEYEPNNSIHAAADATFAPPISATTCTWDNDYYIFTPNVDEGAYFGVLVEFSNEISDIDIALFDSDGEEVAYSGSYDNWEEVGAAADGRPFVLRVFPYMQMTEPNTYTVAFVDIVPSNCCTTSIVPGCTDPEVESCVCDVDPWCCEYGFDEYCVEEAFAVCAVQCKLNDGSCCETSSSAGPAP